MTAVVITHPRAVELVERAKLRKQVARAVSRLIAVLDELDGDPEAEPWLGAPDVSFHVPQWPKCTNDDREQEDEHGGDILDGGDDDQVDGEPSLGAAENPHDQTRWGQGERRVAKEMTGSESRSAPAAAVYDTPCRSFGSSHAPFPAASLPSLATNPPKTASLVRSGGDVLT